MRPLWILLLAAAFGGSACGLAEAVTPEGSSGPSRKHAFHGCWDLVVTPLKIQRGSDDSVRMCLHTNGLGSRFYSNDMHSGSEGLRWQIIGDRLTTRLYIDEDGEMETPCDVRVISSQWLDLQNCSLNGKAVERSYWLLRCADLNEGADSCAEP